MQEDKLNGLTNIISALMSANTDKSFTDAYDFMLSLKGVDGIVQAMAFLVQQINKKKVNVAKYCSQIASELNTIVTGIVGKLPQMKAFDVPKYLTVILDIAWVYHRVSISDQGGMFSFNAVQASLLEATRKAVEQKSESIADTYSAIGNYSWRFREMDCAPISLSMLLEIQKEPNEVDGALNWLRAYVNVFKYDLDPNASEKDVDAIGKTPRYFSFNDRLFSDTIFVALPLMYAKDSKFFDTSLPADQRQSALKDALKAIKKDLNLDPTDCVYVQCHYANTKLGSITNELISLADMQMAAQTAFDVAKEAEKSRPDARWIRNLRALSAKYVQDSPRQIDASYLGITYSVVFTFLNKLPDDKLRTIDSLQAAFSAGIRIPTLLKKYNAEGKDLARKVLLEEIIKQTNILANALTDFADTFEERTLVFAPHTYDMDKTVRKNRRGVVVLHLDAEAYDYVAPPKTSPMVFYRRYSNDRIPTRGAALLAWIKSEGVARGINPFGRFGSYTPVGVLASDPKFEKEAAAVVKQAQSDWPDCAPSADPLYKQGLVYLLDKPPDNWKDYIVLHVGKIVLIQKAGIVEDRRDYSQDTGYGKTFPDYPLPSQDQIRNADAIAHLLPDTKLLPQAWSFIVSHISGRPRVSGDDAMGLYTSELIRLANNLKQIVPGYEWLHIIARSLAGLEQPNNFLCGNCNANSWNMVWETIVTRYLSSKFHVIYAVQNTEAPAEKDSWLGWVPSAKARECQHVLAIRLDDEKELASLLEKLTVSAAALGYEASATRFPKLGADGQEIMDQLLKVLGDKGTYYRSIDIPFYMDARPSKWINAAIKVYLDLENIAEEADEDAKQSKESKEEKW